MLALLDSFPCICDWPQESSSAERHAAVGLALRCKEGRRKTQGASAALSHGLPNLATAI
jgi:hypothetical protein